MEPGLRYEHVEPVFSGLGAAAGVLREIRNAKQSGSPLEEIPMGTIMKGSLLGAGVGLAADLALLGMTARRRGEERKRSGPSGGHHRGGNRPNQTTHSMRRSGKSGGSLPVRVD